MASLPAHSVLYFRVYREVTIPLYTEMVAQICASPDLPLELATTLEDIGQEFMGFAATINAELLRRGFLDDEAEPDETVEARIDALVEEIALGRKTPRSGGRDQAQALLSEDAVRQALRVALVMIRDLPSAQQLLANALVRKTAPARP